MVLPAGYTVGEVLAAIGVRTGPQTRMFRERGVVPIETTHGIEAFRDGDVVTLIAEGAPAAVPRKRDRRRTDGARTENVAAWWAMGAVGIVLSVFLAFTPGATLTGWPLVIGCVIVVAAVAAAVVLTRRGHTRAIGAASLGPAALLGGAGVVLSPPSSFSIAVTIATVCALIAVYSFGLATLAKLPGDRAQLGAIGAVVTGVGVVHIVAAMLGLPEATAAAFCVGAAPLVLRALPAMLIDVPAGMFIDFERHQQVRWAVREQMPEPVLRVDGARVGNLLRRSRARMQTVTIAVCVSAAVFAPIALLPLDPESLTEMIGRLCLAGLVVVVLALSARRHGATVIAWTLRATAVFVLVVLAIGLLGVFTPQTRMFVTIGLLVVAVLIAAGSVPVARGLRSLYWSRFGDISEAIAVALCLPAGLVAGGMIDIIRGW
ncbi:hypothetical protein [Microbacterium sp. GXS0129]|uniref:hypothetical protein n=1 Tax=Microbacterium sp. GXS0129 TaxID=3377836 RepID=UPI00383A17A1